MSDLRSLPDGILKAYLYAIGGWGAVLAVLYPLGELRWALTLCFPLALWQAGLTAWWWIRVGQIAPELRLTGREVSSGVRSVARILAASGLLPGIVFLAQDPLIAEGWGALVGVAVLSGTGWLVANLGPRLRIDAARLAVLTACWLVLPVNATGTLSWAVFRGWYTTVVEVVP